MEQSPLLPARREPRRAHASTLAGFVAWQPFGRTGIAQVRSAKSSKCREKTGVRRPARCEPVGSADLGERSRLAAASPAKIAKTAEKQPACSRHRFCKTRAPLPPSRPLTPQVRRPGGGQNAEIIERNKPRDEIQPANLLDRFPIPQVEPRSQALPGTALARGPASSSLDHAGRDRAAEPRGQCVPRRSWGTRDSGALGPTSSSGRRAGARRFYRLTPLWPKWQRANCRAKNGQMQRENGTRCCRAPHSGAWPRRRRAQNAAHELACNCENGPRKPAGCEFRVFSRWLKTGSRRCGERAHCAGLEARNCRIVRGIRLSERSERPH